MQSISNVRKRSITKSCVDLGGGAEVDALEDSVDNYTFLSVISSTEITNVGINLWKIPIVINSTKVLFEVDTEAVISVIPESDLKKLNVAMKQAMVASRHIK